MIDEIKTAQIACYNALAATNEERKQYWSIRFIRAMRPVLRDGKIRRHVYQEKEKLIRSIDEILTQG